CPKVATASEAAESKYLSLRRFRPFSRSPGCVQLRPLCRAKTRRTAGRHLLPPRSRDREDARRRRDLAAAHSPRRSAQEPLRRNRSESAQEKTVYACPPKGPRACRTEWGR